MKIVAGFYKVQCKHVEQGVVGCAYVSVWNCLGYAKLAKSDYV